jgi:hypothetical protein
MNDTSIARNVTGLQMPGVRPLQQRHPWVHAQLVRDLPITCVDGHHHSRAMLEHAIRESTCRGAHVRACASLQIDLPVRECRLQLQAAAAHIAQIVAQQPHHCIRGNVRTRLLHLLLVHQHTPGKDQRLRALTRWHEAALRQKLVEPRFHTDIPSNQTGAEALLLSDSASGGCV